MDTRAEIPQTGRNWSRWGWIGLATAAVILIIAAVILTILNLLSPKVDASTIVAHGNELYRNECLSCHGPTGDRLPLAPIGSKEFLNTRGDATLMAVVREGKGVMPAFGEVRGGPFDEDEVRAVVAYMNKRAGRESASILADVGNQLFSSNCITCHGPNGDRIPIAPLNTKGFLDTKTDTELKEAISDGKGPMPAFLTLKGGELSEYDITAIVAFLRNQGEERVATTASLGRELYLGNCVQCHGVTGANIAGIELASPAFLRSLGDGAIISSINDGRNIMPAFGASAGGTMSITEIASLLAYIKSWAGVSATSALIALGTGGEGRDIFLKNCAACHGDGGDRVPGIKLLSTEFLARETDAVLIDTITQGNAKGMPAWGDEAGGPLTRAQIETVVDFLKTAAVSEVARVPGDRQQSNSAPPQQGNSSDLASLSQEAVAHGKEIFTSTCVACHGETRDKIPTCRLADPEFFAERGDQALMDSVTFGKGAMPSWGAENGGPLSPEDVQDVLAYLKDAVGLGATSENGQAQTQEPLASAGPALTTEIISQGKEVFMGTCAACHGETRDKIPTCQLANGEWLEGRGFDGIVTAITDGKPPAMPAWGASLSQDEIIAVANYLWDAAGLGGGGNENGSAHITEPSSNETLSKEVKVAKLTGPELGEEIFTSTCVMCHGADGLNIPQCPLGSKEWLSNMSLEGLMSRIRRGKPGAGMPAWGVDFGGHLSEDDIYSVAQYLGQASR